MAWVPGQTMGCLSISHSVVKPILRAWSRDHPPTTQKSLSLLFSIWHWGQRFCRWPATVPSGVQVVWPAWWFYSPLLCPTHQLLNHIELSGSQRKYCKTDWQETKIVVKNPRDCARAGLGKEHHSTLGEGFHSAETPWAGRNWF